MSKTRFDWQTTEDEDFVLPQESAAGGCGRRRHRLLLGTVLFLVVIGVLAGSYVLRRQQRLAEGLRQDVLASFNLWLQAVEEHDQELFAQLLVPDNQAWRHNQQRLLSRDLIVGRPFLSLAAVTASEKTPAVTLSPDWQQATVAFEEVYGAVQSGEPLRLEHTVVFERRGASWLQKTPDAGFWGGWESLATDILVLEFPARDAEIAERIGHHLEADLRAICAGRDTTGSFSANRCEQLQPFVFTLTANAESLIMLEQPGGFLLPGASFEMPAPSLTGVPVDEAGFAGYYEAYTHRLREHVRTLVSSPIPMPQQVIRTLCFDYPTLGPRLFKFDPAAGTWVQELPKRSFRALHSLGDGQGLILDEIIGNYQSPNTHLIHLRQGSERTLLDEISRETPYRIVSPTSSSDPNLLLRARSADGTRFVYKSLNLDTCGQIECEASDLPGYTVWSPDGRHSLIAQGGDILVADQEGQNPRLLGKGTSQLWLDDDTAAFVQFLAQNTSLTTGLLAKDVLSGDETVVFEAGDLARAAGIEGAMLFIKSVTQLPPGGRSLLVHAGGLGAYAGHYFIFTVHYAGEPEQNEPLDIRLHLQREGTISGDDGHFGPNGPLPFLPSPDGRWLLVSEMIGHNVPSRTFLLVDLAGGETKTIADGEPVFPAQFPSYDWSTDGRWLVIAGNNFFRIVAPAYDYEQLLPHEFDYCAFTRWSD